MIELPTPPPWFLDLLARYPRLAIAGGPGVGKTTFAGFATDRPRFSTDDILHLPWGDVPHAVIAHCATLGPSFVVEGVQVARSLRKGLEVDAVLILETQRRELVKPASRALAKGVATVLTDWRSKLSTRIEDFGKSTPHIYNESRMPGWMPELQVTGT